MPATATRRRRQSTVSLTREERRDMRRAAEIQTKKTGELVRPLELLRIEGMKGIRSILAAESPSQAAA